MNRRERAAHYVLNNVVGPNLPEWWASFFAAGYGAILAIVGSGALSLGVFQGLVADWFSDMTRVFGMLLLLNGLLGLDALHKKKKLVRMFSSVVACFAMLWVSVFYVLVVPVPWQAVWVYLAHASLEALVYLRIRHNLTEYW